MCGCVCVGVGISEAVSFCQALASIVCFGFGSLYYTRGKQIGLVRFPVHL